MKAAAQPSPFCALCLDPIVGRPPTRRPFGRNDALVNVCTDCDEARPVAVDNRRDYDPTPRLTVEEFRAGLARMAKSLKARPGDQPKPSPSTVSDGYLLFRVPITGPDGTKRDQFEAAKAFAGAGWARRARYLGIGGDRWHLFERPAPPQRRTVHLGGVLDALAPFKTKRGAR